MNLKQKPSATRCLTISLCSQNPPKCSTQDMHIFSNKLKGADPILLPDNLFSFLYTIAYNLTARKVNQISHQKENQHIHVKSISKENSLLSPYENHNKGKHHHAMCN